MALVQVRVEIYPSLHPHLAELVAGRIHGRAEKVLARAVETAPEETGRWKESLHIEAHRRPGAWRVGSDDPRSIHIEYGTSDTPEHATLRRALDAAREG